MSGRYQVVGECAHVVTRDHSGVSTLKLLYTGAFLPDDVDPQRLKHLLDTGLVAKEGPVPLAPNDPIGPSGAAEPEGDGAHPVVTEEQRQAQREATEHNDATQKPETDDEDAAAEQRRAAARSKLPADGSAPKGNSGKDVWVEYAVTKGYDRTEVEKADRDDIRDLFAK